MNIKETKQQYELLVWVCVKANKPIPKHYNLILDAIEQIEDLQNKIHKLKTRGILSRLNSLPAKGV